MKGGKEKGGKEEGHDPPWLSPWWVSACTVERHEGKGRGGSRKERNWRYASWKGESRSFDAIVGRQIGCTRGKWDWFLSGSPGAPPAGGMP